MTEHPYSNAAANTPAAITTGIAIIGCGTVGAATARLLTAETRRLAARTGCSLELKWIVDTDLRRARTIIETVPGPTLSENYGLALADPAVSVVVELVGGLGFARTLIREALLAGKHVVTANKALLAHHGVELFALAREKGVSLAFEASCGGGIPIVRALIDGLIANRIDALYGIVNGTCNFILTAMFEQGRSYAEALAGAQTAGFAEADPRLDVNGVDSAHKIALMSALAFGGRVDFDRIPVAGIDTITAADVAFGAEMGLVVKLVASAVRESDGVMICVRPAFISKDHPLAWVAGAFNAISVYGHATGHTMYYGRGAGGSPTASAVVSDIVSIALGVYPLQFSQLGNWPDRSPALPTADGAAQVGKWYLRLTVADQPGVLAEVTRVLADHQLSVSSILQHEPSTAVGRSAGVVHTAGGGASPVTATAAALPPVAGDEERPPVAGDGVPLFIVLHPAMAKHLDAAVATLAGHRAVVDPPVIIPILDEHHESAL